MQCNSSFIMHLSTSESFLHLSLQRKPPQNKRNCWIAFFYWTLVAEYKDTRLLFHFPWTELKNIWLQIAEHTSKYTVVAGSVWGNWSFLHEFHENCHSVSFYFMKIDSKPCCDTTTPESIHTKDESKRDFAFAFIFGMNWPVQWM